MDQENALSTMKKAKKSELDDSNHTGTSSHKREGAGGACGDDADDGDAKMFPQRLMEILSDEEKTGDSIGWLPHGRAFVVKDRKLFGDEVLPRYFSRRAKFSSFVRKLNRW